MDREYCILLVEDDSSLGYLLSEYLKMKEFKVSWAKNGKLALDLLLERGFDLAIIDVMMPEMDGFSLAMEMKQTYPNIPFLFLTARSLKIDVLKGFSLGAVDYLKKPIDEEELVVRIRTLLSHLQKDTNLVSAGSTIILGEYEFNSLNQELKHPVGTFHLTGRENDLLKLLAAKSNQLCTHKEILTTLWGRNDYFNRKSLNVFITKLRKYLEHDSRLSIENVHGKGFILRDETQ